LKANIQGSGARALELGILPRVGAGAGGQFKTKELELKLWLYLGSSGSWPLPRY